MGETVCGNKLPGFFRIAPGGCKGDRFRGTGRRDRRKIEVLFQQRKAFGVRLVELLVKLVELHEHAGIARVKLNGCLQRAQRFCEIVLFVVIS